jgi:hypothetical protein
MENSQEDGQFPKPNFFAFYMLILQVAYMYCGWCRGHANQLKNIEERSSFIKQLDLVATLLL